MNGFARLRRLLVLAALAPLLMIIQPSGVDAQAQPVARQLRREPPPQKPQVTMNAWTVGLAGGFLEGAPIRLAAEIARVVDDGDKLHVLPIGTRGATENVNSLLHLRGIDAAINTQGIAAAYSGR